jgi:hypothetical protein
MPSIVADANTSKELIDLPIESATPTVLVPTSPVMGTPALAVALFGLGYQIGVNLGQVTGGRNPRQPVTE